jgi:hypothetical protein
VATPPPPLPDLLDRERFVTSLARRFVLRGHMALIVAAVVLSGVVTSKVLLLLGVGSMRTRYGLAVAAAYLVFVGLVGLWLMYFRRCMTPAEERSSNLGASVGDLATLDIDIGSPAGGDVGPQFVAGGGGSGGGGSSGSFAGVDAPGAGSSVSSAGTGGSHSGSSWSLDLDVDDGVLIVIAFLVFSAIVTVTAGWIIYDAPHMLGEAAFQFFLASGLLRGRAAIRSGGWTGVVVRRTVLPFVIVAIGALGFGHVAQKLCPGARTVVETLRLCVLP